MAGPYYDNFISRIAGFLQISPISVYSTSPSRATFLDKENQPLYSGFRSSPKGMIMV